MVETETVQRDAIRFFGGAVVDPMLFVESVDGFGRFLAASGVKHFSAREMTTPYNATAAQRAGTPILLPPREWWHRGAALALASDHLRHLVGRPVVMRNWWRPRAYDVLVGGSGAGDHVTAHAVDLDFPDVATKARALEQIEGIGRAARRLYLSIGRYPGSRSIHIGIGAPKTLVARTVPRVWDNA